jgi:aminopeptidase N
MSLCSSLLAILCVNPAYAAAATATPAASVRAASRLPFALDRTPGRLPKNVLPVRYVIALTPQPATMRLAGNETITLRFRSPTATLMFDSLNEQLRDVRLDGMSVLSVQSDDEQQLTIVTLPRRMPAGLHKLTFSYTGKLQTNAAGLFVQHYLGSHGQSRLLISSQMESTDARRVFPCWDEPAFRARFELTVTLPAAWSAVSNMPIAHRELHGTLATTTFAPSPPMPSYLVELSAGDLRHIDASADGIRVGVWAVHGRERTGAAALANAQQILADYNQYFGYRYPLPKLDSIAVPGGFGGAMENWGAITYQEGVLLLPPSATIQDRQQVYSVQAHEMAHQWNGDLVTMAWWDALWLNESFASWMSAKETALRHPDWNWWQLQDAERDGAMAADAQPSSPPLEQPVRDEQQAANGFDPTITYSKGQAVLRMLEAYLGPEVFRDGIRRYVRARAFSNATPADLWAALSAASAQNIAALAAPWTEQPGFPLIILSSHCDQDGTRHLDLSQQRFLLRGRPGRERWLIPLQMRTGSGAARPALLARESGSFVAGRCGEPLSLDADALGYYRVQYDAPTLATDTRLFDQLPAGDRIALLDDQWALVQAHRATLGSYLALAQAMGPGLNTRAWQQVAAALGTIEYDERGSAGHAAFAAYARGLLQPLAARLGWDPDATELPDTSELRHTVLLDLGTWGDASVLAEARRRFNLLQRPLQPQQPVSAETRGLVLSLVALDADQSDFDRLHALARTAHDAAEQQTDYQALMLVRDPHLAEQAAAIALSKEIPSDDVQLRLSLIATLVEWHPQLAWMTFSTHANELLAGFGSLAPLMLAQYVPQWFWNSLSPVELDRWVRQRVPAQLAPAIARGMQNVLFKRSQKATLLPEADAYVRAYTRTQPRTP